MDIHMSPDMQGLLPCSNIYPDGVSPWGAAVCLLCKAAQLWGRKVGEAGAASVAVPTELGYEEKSWFANAVWADLSLFCHSEFNIKLKKAEWLPCVQNRPIPACNRWAQCSWASLPCLVGPQFVFIFIPVSTSILACFLQPVPFWIDCTEPSLPSQAEHRLIFFSVYRYF